MYSRSTLSTIQLPRALFKRQRLTEKAFNIAEENADVIGSNLLASNMLDDLVRTT